MLIPQDNVCRCSRLRACRQQSTAARWVHLLTKLSSQSLGKALIQTKSYIMLVICWLYLLVTCNILFVPSDARSNAGGEEDWLVSCVCGCRDDDGERMIACDSCGWWMHLRCQGIPDSAPIPEEFVCNRCKSRMPSK